MRLVFDAPAGSAINASIMDLSNRFRLLVNEVEMAARSQNVNFPERRLRKRYGKGLGI